MRNAAFMVLACSACWGQIGAPLLGYVPDGPGIRAVHGMAASSSVGAPLDTGVEFGMMAVSPTQSYVLGSLASDGSVVTYAPESSVHAIAGAAASPSRIALSPQGSAAVLWFDASSTIQVVRGLPQQPAVETIPAGFLMGSPQALAVSDDGQWVAAGWSNGLYAFGPDSAFQWLPVTAVQALAFFSGSHNLAAANSAGIYKVTDFGGQSAVALVLESGGTVLDTVGLALSPDNQRIVAADSGGRIRSIPAGGGDASSVDCGCKPSGVFPLNRTTYRITGIADGSFRMLDTIKGEILFAPLALDGGAQ